MKLKKMGNEGSQIYELMAAGKTAASQGRQHLPPTPNRISDLYYTTLLLSTSVPKNEFLFLHFRNFKFVI